MGKKFKRYTITAALPYANGPIHIGHLAGVYIPADIYARYLRNKGEDVLFVCGSDENGVAITLQAKRLGTTPQAIIDKYHNMIKNSFEEFNISFDIYSRTSCKTHHEFSRAFFTKIHKDGLLIEKESEQYYDINYNQFLADRYLTGTCPICNHQDAYGDQCENCGATLSPSELINPKSVLSGTTPTKKKTKHWYLPMDNYQKWLEKWILEDHKEWKKNVYQQCKSWLDNKLKSRAITRDLDWGVKVPLKDANGKVLYVWFDAPLGYISATIDWAKAANKNWELYWKDKETKLVHFIGKDNIVFHCIIFPILLKANNDYILPENIPANEFLNLEGNKISTSKNWAVWLHEYLEEFPNQEDALRYTLCANAPEKKDNEFSWKDFQSKNNNELVAILGNFINRTLVLTNKHCNKKVPKINELLEIDKATIQVIENAPKKIGDAIEQYKFREALSEFMELARTGNKYLADNEPWKIIKTDKSRFDTIINISLQISSNIAILMTPFLPNTAKKLQEMLNINYSKWENAGSSKSLKPNHTVKTPILLFNKIEDEEIKKQIDKLFSKEHNIENQAKKTPEMKSEINFKDFTKLDIRVGTILTASKVEKSKKLLNLTVDIGNKNIAILSGIGQHYDPKSIIGQQVSILINLHPRKMMGLESQGMILMAEDEDNNLVFLNPSKKIAPGSTVS